MNKYFFKDLLFISLFFIVVMIVAYEFFDRIGEINIQSVVKRQLEKPQTILFGSGLVDAGFAYKGALYNEIDVKVVIVGSSRAMQVREQFFNVDMLNWGGTVSSISALNFVINEILKKAEKPKQLFLMMDLWWINSEKFEYIANVEKKSYPKIPDGLSIFKVIKYLTEDTFVRIEALQTSPNLGLFSIFNDQGSAKDGSWYYSGRLVKENKKAGDDILHQLRVNVDGKNNKLWFLDPNEGDLLLLDKIIVILERLKKYSIKTIVVMPSFGQAVVDYLNKIDGMEKRYEDIKNRFNRANIEYYNHTDAQFIQPKHINAECEFLDDFHGGDVLYARIFKDIYEKTEDEQIKSTINIQFIDDLLSSKSGYAEGIDMFKRGQHEKNFRGIECH